MRKLLPLTILVTVIILLAAGSIWAKEDVNTEYLMNVADYFDVSYEEVNTIASGNITIEEVPVVFYMAKLSNKSSQYVLTAIDNGTTWSNYMKQHRIHQGSVLVNINKFNTPECKGILDKIRNRPLSSVEFDKQDIIVLVNYNFLANTNKMHISEIVNKRDEQKGSIKSFMEINHLLVKQSELAQAESND